MNGRRVALALGGGAARALAHVGVIEALEAAGIAPTFVAGSSMGGLVGALWAAGLSGRAIREVARGFRFPSWFIPGGMMSWDRVFPTAVPVLAGRSFTDLPRGLSVVAADVESGRRVVLRDGAVLPAVRATCAVPGVLPPVRIGGRWLVDGGLVSVVPVDVAALGVPDVLIAVHVRAGVERKLPSLRHAAGWAAGRLFPNPATAWLAFDLLVRAAEIVLDRQVALASAMIAPDVLVEVDVGTIGLRDFERLEDAATAGRLATEAALPTIRAALEASGSSRRLPGPVLGVDPICDMFVDPGDAPAALDSSGLRQHFCSVGCRDAFLRGRRRTAEHSIIGTHPVA